MRLRIKRGRVIDPANGVDGIQDLYIAEGRIVGCGRAPDGFSAERIIDASDRIVCPGLVDLRASLREPGQEATATIASETRAAARGGVTTLCCPPGTEPVIDTPAVATLIQGRAAAIGMARVVPIGALTRALDGEHLSEMAALKAAGCPAVGNDYRPVRNYLIMRRAMEYAATFDLTVIVNPQDPWLADSGSVHEGAVSSRLGLPGIPAAAEAVAVAAHIALAEQIGARIHFSLLSSLRGAQMVARAQHEGLPVTADVSAHHLHLTENDVLDFDSQCHVLPPLRTERDRDALRHWLAAGAITAICSDHQPREPDGKLAPFTDTAPGISALETLLPLSLRLADDGALPLADLVARLTCQPARVLGLEAGTLGINSPADVCIFDPERYWTLSAGSMLSRGRNTPFLDWELKGQVTHTLLDGRVVFEEQSKAPR